MLARTIVVILAGISSLSACDERKTRKDTQVLLFVAQDTDHRTSLFQKSPSGKISGIDFGPGSIFRSAAVSPGGTAVAITLSVGDQTVVRVMTPGKSGHTDLPLARSGGRIRAVNDDGASVVLQQLSGELIVQKLGGNSAKPIVVKPPGRLMYAVDLSPDGSHLAFSTMKPDCSSFSKMATCPVGLYYVDLKSPPFAPRPIAVLPNTVNYDPQFIHEDGKQLLYMSSEGDKSEACRQHVNDCTYSLRRVDFTGKKSEIVERNAVFGRMVADGNLFFRRLKQSPNRPRSFSPTTLWRRAKGGKPVQIGDGLALWLHKPSPDGGWLAYQVKVKESPSGEMLLTIARSAGEVVDQVRSGNDLRLVGWAANPLPVGKQQLRAPTSTRLIGLLIEELTRPSYKKTPFVFHGLGPGLPAGHLGQSPVMVIDETAAVLDWMKKNKTGQVITRREPFCALRQTVRVPVVDFAVVDIVGANLLLVGTRQAETKHDGNAEPFALFEFPEGVGHAELVRTDLPISGYIGKLVYISLHWRLSAPPPKGWKVFVHIEGQGKRFSADHDLISCTLSDFKPGEIHQDNLGIEVKTSRPGSYRVYAGWYRAGKRAKATGAKRDDTDRVEIGTIKVK
jgi:hypothetical protein